MLKMQLEMLHEFVGFLKFNGREKFGIPSPKSWRPNTAYFRAFLQEIRRMSMNDFVTKRGICIVYTFFICQQLTLHML